MTKRIGILTGGGDAPGLNAVIRAAVLSASNRNQWEVVGIPQGFDGLIAKAEPILLYPETVRPILARGGTILGAVNRGNPFVRAIDRPDGSVDYVDVAHEALERIDELGLSAVVAAGGDGTMAIAHRLVTMGAPIVGVPKTIDNDLGGTDVTFGFDTAILTATEALDKLQTTAESHHRVMVMEVMGRNAGWIALVSGVAGGADAILIPEIPFDINVVCERLERLRAAGRLYCLVVVAEGAAPVGGQQEFYIRGRGLLDARLGGISYLVGNALADCLCADVRVIVLGHLQRGGQPTPRDRWLATRFGAAAVELIEQQRWGWMVALQGNNITSVLMEDAVRTLRVVDADGEMVRMARDLGIVFG